MKRVRPPAVAGQFYPGDRVSLMAVVDDMLAAVAMSDRPAPPALLVPHAGFVYSGATAARAYALWAGAAIDHVVIVGPTHRVWVRAVALPGSDALATPLGQVRVWQEGVALVRDMPQVMVSQAVHAEEHSLEVQLPFLQRVLPDADVLPLAAGSVAPEQVTEVLDTLWGTPNMGVVISSDLSHYHQYDEARAIDQATIDQVLALAPTISHDQACGATGLNAMLLVAQAQGLKPRLLGTCNSGDTAGDKRRVVGYAAVAFEDQEWL